MIGVKCHANIVLFIKKLFADAGGSFIFMVEQIIDFLNNMTFKKGNTLWKKRKTFKISKNTRRKISKTLTGKSWGKHTDEYKDYMRRLAIERGYKPPIKYGKEHPMWKGGKQRNRHCTNKYKKWRLFIFERDHYTCQICKKIGGYLEAHHLLSWSNYPKLRYKTYNGITLCKECHKKVTNTNY